MTQLASVAMLESLATDGYVVIENYFDRALCRQLQLEASALAADLAAIDAGIGRGVGHARAPAVRQARIRWLDAATPAQAKFMAAAEALRLALNRQLYLGLFEFEAQLALTPVGGFYARHIDSFHGRSNRIVSLVAYLNDDWQADDGGCLRIWPHSAVAHEDGTPDTRPRVDVMPAAATLVLMLSETVPHEVLSSLRPRASIAGWFSGRS